MSCFVVIARLDRATQYSRALVINREAAAYWIPAFAGMTSSLQRRSTHAHAFFFTSLMLENVMPSARSLV